MLGKDESEALDALRKPASFIELTEIDPRDYFGGEVKSTSTYGPRLLPEGVGTESSTVVPEPRDSQKALEDFRQLQRDFGEGLVPHGEAVWQSIRHLGAVDDPGVAWAEIEPSVAIEVRATLRRALVEPVEGASPAMAAAMSRLAAWAQNVGVLERDAAFEFMSQPPERILEFVRLNMGQALPDPGMSWYALAADALCRSPESADAGVWFTIAVELYGWLASQKPDPDHSSLKESEMHARADRLRLASTSPADRELDRQAIFDWFFRNESMAPSQAAICPRDWFRKTPEERKSQVRIRRKLSVFQVLDNKGEPIPDRIREWFALLPHLR